MILITTAFVISLWIWDHGLFDSGPALEWIVTYRRRYDQAPYRTRRTSPTGWVTRYPVGFT